MMQSKLERPGNKIMMQKSYATMAMVLLCAGSLITSSPAYAEKADREKPINIESDRVTVDDVKQLSVFEGSVMLTQGTMVIRGDRMEVRQDKEGFKLGTVWGNLAYFKQKREGLDENVEGWGERIEYDSRADKVQLFKRAAMKRGADDVAGDYISYDATTEFFQVIGGGSKTATANNPDGRVRAVLQPKSKTKPPAQPPVPLRSSDTIAAPREEPGTQR
jgi:lipopolysaccharide export system protein LptA